MRRHVYLLLVGLTFIFSCENDKKKSIDKLLIGEWMLDSISGTFNKLDRDFAFITESGKFWKFTYWNDQYLIDSNLTINGKEVFNDKTRVYQIQMLDTLHLTMTDNSGNIFFYRNQDKTWKTDYKAELSQFISKYTTHKLVNGWWKLTNASFRPMKLLNYPDEIYDFTMYLSKNGEATIYINDIIDSTISYSWKADSMALSFGRGDVIGRDEQIISLDKNELVLVLNTRKDYIPTKDTLKFIRCRPLTE